MRHRPKRNGVKCSVWLCALAAGLALVPAARAQETPADQWAAQVEAQMTDDERFSLIHGFMALPFGPDRRTDWPADVVLGAGYIRGVPRLGVPPLRETDASLGVTNPFGLRQGDTATALPAGLAMGATFNPELAHEGGRAIGLEARSKGFNVLLDGGVNLARDPRNGRNFEYISEDPLLSGLMAGAAVRGAQEGGVVSTVKHYVLNSNETNRHRWDARIDWGALRESDLLAFQIAIERGQPGSVMCAYNLVNGEESCGHDRLLNGVLKRDWGYRGWVMSDWGAVEGADFALKGLDQQSGEQLDDQVWFDAPLRRMLADGSFPRARLSDMVRRILRSMKTVGVTDQQPAPQIDAAAHARIALTVAHQGIVVLRNEGVLPIASGARRIGVIGGRADTGVLSGGGSSQVLPPGGWAASNPLGGAGQMGNWRTERWFAGAPLEALRAALPDATITYDPGLYEADATALAARSDLVIVFVSKHETEGFDSPDLGLPYGQDAIIAAAARANPNTVVVLETGNPVAMPWRDNVKAIVAAWYPGQEGGTAIADILTGKVNPSGRLPITFPRSVDQLPRPQIPDYGAPAGGTTVAQINEGADVGYRWFAKNNQTPLYAFGHGLSYTSFTYSNLSLRARGDAVRATFTVRNTGRVAGADVPQIYLQSRAGAQTPRLLGFQRIELAPRRSRTISIDIDRRLLADYDDAGGRWRIPAGRYAIALSRAADAPVATREVTLSQSEFED